MPSTTTPPVVQIYDTFGRWQYVLPQPPTLTAAPTAGLSGSLGTVVVVPSTNSAYVLVSGSGTNNTANWQEITAGGAAGPGNFTTLHASGAVTFDSTLLVTGTSTFTGLITANGGLTTPVSLATTGTGTLSVTGNTSLATAAATTTVNIANVIPTANRTTIIGGGLLGSAVFDDIAIGSGGVNFAGSSRLTTIGDGNVTIGTNAVTIAGGAIGAAGVQTIEIGDGAITAGGTNTITIGSTSAGSSTVMNTPATTVAGTGLGVKCGAGATINILAGNGAPTNGVTLAPAGSLYSDTSGGAVNARLYFASAANTWVAISTQA